MGALDGLADIIADVVTSEGLGATITYTSIAGEAYDPATSTSVTASSDETVIGIIEDFKGLDLLNGTVEQGDKKVSIPAPLLTATPKPGDAVTVGADTYRVERVNTVQAGEEIALYVLQCRRG